MRFPDPGGPTKFRWLSARPSLFPLVGLWSSATVRATRCLGVRYPASRTQRCSQYAARPALSYSCRAGSKRRRAPVWSPSAAARLPAADSAIARHAELANIRATREAESAWPRALSGSSGKANALAATGSAAHGKWGSNRSAAAPAARTERTARVGSPCSTEAKAAVEWMRPDRCRAMADTVAIAQARPGDLHLAVRTLADRKLGAPLPRVRPSGNRSRRAVRSSAPGILQPRPTAHAAARTPSRHHAKACARAALASSARAIRRRA
jgi:hypothetical protein